MPGMACWSEQSGRGERLMQDLTERTYPAGEELVAGFGPSCLEEQGRFQQRPRRGRDRPHTQRSRISDTNRAGIDQGIDGEGHARNRFEFLERGAGEQLDRRRGGVGRIGSVGTNAVDDLLIHRCGGQSRAHGIGQIRRQFQVDAVESECGLETA